MEKGKKQHKILDQTILPAFLDEEPDIEVAPTQTVLPAALGSETDGYNSLFSKIDRIESLERKSNDLTRDIPVVKCTAPERSLQTKDKISLTILDSHIVNQGEQNLEMTKRDAADPVMTKVSLSLDLDELLNDHDVIITNYEFTYYDKAVFDAICSLINIGNEFITLPMIVRMMTGKRSGYNPSEKAIQLIEQSIRKMGKMLIKIDISEEWKAFKSIRTPEAKNIIEKSGMIIEERFFNYRMITASVGGRILPVIQPLSVPALFRYATIRRQISSIAVAVLDTPVAKNLSTLCCQGFLLQRITAMKSSPKLSRFILFEKIYEASLWDEGDGETNLKNKTRSLQANVCSILDYWVSIQFIKDYKIHRLNHKKYGKIEIILSEDK